MEVLSKDKVLLKEMWEINCFFLLEKPALYLKVKILKCFLKDKYQYEVAYDLYQLVYSRTSLTVQWLRLHTSSAEDKGLILGWETNPYPVQCSQKKKKVSTSDIAVDSFRGLSW